MPNVVFRFKSKGKIGWMWRLLISIGRIKKKNFFIVFVCLFVFCIFWLDVEDPHINWEDYEKERIRDLQQIQLWNICNTEAG